MALTEQRLQTICLVTLTVIVGGVVLHLLQVVFLPFLVAVFIALGLSELVTWLVRRLRVPVGMAVVLTLVLTWVFFLLLAALIAASVDQMIASAGVYEGQLHLLLQKLMALVPLRHLGLSPERLGEVLQQLPLQSIAVGIGSSVLDILSLSTMVLLYVFYLLFVLAEHRQDGGIWREIVGRVRSYLVAKTVISVATGIIIGIVLYFCGSRFSVVFGVFAAMLNFIPFAGPIIASVAPWPELLLSPGLATTPLIIAIFFPGVLFFIVGNFIEPKFLGRAVQLHPLTVLLTLIFWGVLWGPMGVLLATPITGVLTLLLSYAPATRPIANLLAGTSAQPATPPARLS